MLTWWILSLIILIVCIIFAYRMIVSTYDFLPVDKRYFLGSYKKPVLNDAGPVQGDKLKSLNKKMQAVEDNSTFYGMQFSKFQDRLKALEELNTFPSSPPSKHTKIAPQDEEDWEEMYYEENAVKEKLENELDHARQMLEQGGNKINGVSEKGSPLAELQSDYESRLHDLHSLQNHIDLLQRKLEAGSDREMELEQLLASEITLREKYSILQREYIELQSEADDLRRRIADLNKKDVKSQSQLIHLNELESKLAISEEETIRLKINLEQLL